MSDHDCGQEWDFVVLNEGDDVLVRQCQVCGLLEWESDGGRPMAWFAFPNYGTQPDGTTCHEKYAYAAEAHLHNHPDAPRVWKRAPSAETDVSGLGGGSPLP